MKIVRESIYEGFTHLQPKSKEDIKDNIKKMNLRGTDKFNDILEKTIENYQLISAKVWRNFLTKELEPRFEFKSHDIFFKVVEGQDIIYMRYLPLASSAYSDAIEIHNFEDLQHHINKIISSTK